MVSCFLFSRHKCHFEMETKRFYPGSLVSGCIVFDLYKDIRGVQEVTITFSGESGVDKGSDPLNRYMVCEPEFDDGNHRLLDRYDSSHSFNREQYFKHEQQLYDSSKTGCTKFTRAQHRFPFSFRLPKDIPASMKFDDYNEGGVSVHYYLDAKIRRSGCCRSNIYGQRKIYVLGTVPMSACPSDPFKPAVGLKEKHSNAAWHCGRAQGPIKISLELNKTGFVGGEKIVCRAIIDNMSSYDVKSVVIQLRRDVNLFKPKKKNEIWYHWHEHLVAKRDDYGCKPQNTLEIDEELEIPADAAPTDLPHSKTIMPSYSVELEAITGPCSSNLVVKVPIFIASFVDYPVELQKELSSEKRLLAIVDGLKPLPLSLNTLAALLDEKKIRDKPATIN